MTLNDVLFFDTETTGTPGREMRWDTDYADFPYIVQLAWMHGCKVESHIIRPTGWEIPQEAADVHGISTEYALAHGEPLAGVIDKFVQDCHEAGLICGHNIYFDTSIIKANILRELGPSYYEVNDVDGALYKGKRIDTMRPTMKWVDARMSNGRLKFPNLSELYSRCFPGEAFPAHDALEDCKAVARCLPVIVEQGLVELKVREYAGDSAEAAPDFSKAAQNATDAARKFGESAKNALNSSILKDNPEKVKHPAPPEKVSKNGDLTKITDIEKQLLEANDF